MGTSATRSLTELLVGYVDARDSYQQRLVPPPPPASTSKSPDRKGHRLTLDTHTALFHAGLGFHEEEIINRFGVATGELDFYKVRMTQVACALSASTDPSQHLLVARIATTVSLALSKISILLLCSRVFTSKTFHLISNLTMGLISVW